MQRAVVLWVFAAGAGAVLGRLLDSAAASRGGEFISYCARRARLAYLRSTLRPLGRYHPGENHDHC